MPNNVVTVDDNYSQALVYLPPALTLHSPYFIPSWLQVKEIVELLDKSARAVRAGPAGGSKSERGEAMPSVKVIKRQTVMVSATLDKGVSRLAAVLLSK